MWRREIDWRCVILSLLEEQETSERCLVLSDPCSIASDLTDPDRRTECSRSERLPVWPVPKGLTVWPVDRWLLNRPFHSLPGVMTGVARRGSFHRGYWFRPRGSRLYSVPKVESPGGEFWLPAELEPWRITCEAAGSQYLPARSLVRDLAGVELWVARLHVGDFRPVVPCERCLETWVLSRMCSPPMMTETAIRSVQGPAFGLELEELLEVKLLCHHSLSKSPTRHRRLSTGRKYT